MSGSCNHHDDCDHQGHIGPLNVIFGGHDTCAPFCTHDSSVYRTCRQPVQSFLASFENQQFPPGVACHGLVEVPRQALCSYQGRFLNERFVEDCGFLHGPKGVLIKCGSCEICKHQDGTTWLHGDMVGNCASNLFDVLGRTV